jgi:Domain of unknown function (DUF6265)
MMGIVLGRLPLLALIAPSPHAYEGIERLAWLQGCWAGANSNSEFTEQWMKPAAKTMIGMGRTIRGDKVLSYQFLLLKQDETGSVCYVARPSGQSEASFKLVKSGPNEATFENPEHDFPQRVMYRLNADGSLFTRIEGKRAGKDQGVSFPMKRVPCD